jgi:hypothetical protein
MYMGDAAASYGNEKVYRIQKRKYARNHAGVLTFLH